MRIALGQINPTVGDLRGNVDRMVAVSRDAADQHAEIVAFPELSVNGYPPRDLVDKESFLQRTEEELERLASETRDLPLSVVAGYVGRAGRNATGKRATNSAAILCGGSIRFRQDKMLLPTYDVFDEARWFLPADHQSITEVRQYSCCRHDLRGCLE